MLRYQVRSGRRVRRLLREGEIAYLEQRLAGCFDRRMHAAQRQHRRRSVQLTWIASV